MTRRSALVALGALAAGVLTIAACAARAPAPPAGLVVDWDRYAGRWYELARYDHGFERGLVAVTADYAKLPDGAISVVNAGRRGTLDGTPKRAEARAEAVGPAELSVTFFWPFSGAYRVLALDPGYRWAVVGSSTRGYLWFLHRSPQADPADWAEMEAAATALGYDLAPLIRVQQPAE
jgi:apolipoprotein D and lipocalin family protein